MARSAVKRSHSSVARSSSSSSPDASFRRFVADSLTALRTEAPDAHRAMCRGLAGRRLRLVVGGEPVDLTFTSDDVALGPLAASPHVELATSRRTILDVVDGRVTLIGAALADALTLRGRPRDITAFHDALVAYVHGGVRAPSFRGLLRDFRAEEARS